MERDQWDAMGRPHGWIGGVVEMAPAVTQHLGAAVAVRSLLAYPQGLAVDFLLQAAEPADASRWLYGPDAAVCALVFDDGHRVAQDARHCDPGDAAPRLRSSGGGSSGASLHDEWWVAPLPAAGGLRIVLGWPRLGVPETAFRVEAAQLRAAVGRAFRSRDGR